MSYETDKAKSELTAAENCEVSVVDLVCAERRIRSLGMGEILELFRTLKVEDLEALAEYLTLRLSYHRQVASRMPKVPVPSLKLPELPKLKFEVKPIEVKIPEPPVIPNLNLNSD